MDPYPIATFFYLKVFSMTRIEVGGVFPLIPFNWLIIFRFMTLSENAELSPRMIYKNGYDGDKKLQQQSIMRNFPSHFYCKLDRHLLYSMQILHLCWNIQYHPLNIL